MLLVTKYRFESAHWLEGYPGACARTHGHSYHLDVAIEGDLNDPMGSSPDPQQDCMVTDFGNIKEVVRPEVEDKFDHSALNKHFAGMQTTAENIALWICNLLMQRFESADFDVAWVRLWETENCYVEVTPEDVPQ